jgi:small-conductance mechanosensitive channel
VLPDAVHPASLIAAGLLRAELPAGALPAGVLPTSTLADVLERTWLGNPLTEWLRAAIVLVAAFLFLGIAKRLVVARLAVVAQRTSTEVDDLVVELVRRTRHWFLFLLAFWLAHHFIDWPGPEDPALEGPWERRIGILVHLGSFVQAGLWGKGLLEFGIRRLVGQGSRTDRERAMGAGILSFLGATILWSLVVLLCLSALGVNVNALIASLGVGGIAVALAAQNVLGDLFASIAILLDKPFVVGDSIQVGDFQGTVERIGVKTTRLRSVNGEEIVVGNSDLVSSRLRNFKRAEERRVVTNIAIDLDTQHVVVRRLPALLEEIVRAVPDARFDRAHFKGLGPGSLEFELSYFATRLEANGLMDAQQAVGLAIHERFLAEGIRFALPTQVLRDER